MVSAEWEEAAAAMIGARAGVKIVGLGEAVLGIGDEAVFMPPVSYTLARAMSSSRSAFTMPTTLATRPRLWLR